MIKNLLTPYVSYRTRVFSLLKKSLEIKITNYKKNTPDYPKSMLQDIKNSLEFTCCTDKYAACYLSERIEMYRRMVVEKHKATLEKLYTEAKNILTSGKV